MQDYLIRFNIKIILFQIAKSGNWNLRCPFNLTHVRVLPGDMALFFHYRIFFGFVFYFGSGEKKLSIYFYGRGFCSHHARLELSEKGRAIKKIGRWPCKIIQVRLKLMCVCLFVQISIYIYSCYPMGMNNKSCGKWNVTLLCLSVHLSVSQKCCFLCCYLIKIDCRFFL